MAYDNYLPGYPHRSFCIFCELVIEKDSPDAPWEVKTHPQFGNEPECPKAPNPEDGPMPGHQPGRVLTRPEEKPAVLTDPGPQQVPRIPPFIPPKRGDA